MIFIILSTIGILLFLISGIGYVVVNSIALMILELLTVLFSGLIGFIILGLVISKVLISFHKPF